MNCLGWRSRSALRGFTLALTLVLTHLPCWARSPELAPASRPELPLGANSLEVTEHDAAIWIKPEVTSARRGALSAGARLPLLEWLPARAGCPARWFRVGSAAWVCEAVGRLSLLAPQTEDAPLPAGQVLPFAYYFVGPNGSFGYASLRLTDEGIPDSQLEPGFAVAVVRTAQKANGETAALSSHGLWLPLRDLVPARVSTFKGTLLGAEPTRTAWVYTEGARLYQEPGRLAAGAKLPRLTQVEIQAERTTAGQKWLQLAQGPFSAQWLRAKDVRRVDKAPVPKDLTPDERWLDVNTETQVLTAYVGENAVFATLISTGKGAGETLTPLGQHRIWVKLESHDMTNVEDPGVLSQYAIEEVPWVMFFKAGYGLHATFWHDAFGQRRSHGCVNLSPLDAQFLFGWAGPHKPPGWRAALPTAEQPGTRVVVR